MTDLYHGAFCRNPLHPGPCKGWKKGSGSTPAPAKKAAPAKAAPAAKPSPAQAVKQNKDIGTPSRTDKADLAISPKVMEKDWEPHNSKLTKAQREAANLYSTGAHHYMNAYMRTPPGEDPPEVPQKGNLKGLDMAKQVATLQEAMAPAPRGTKVFRGMGFRSAGLSANPTEAEIRGLAGKVMRNDGFTSTSVERTQAFEGFERGIEMELEVPEGTPSLWLNGNSNLPWESELLLASGAKIEVVSVSKKSGTSGDDTVWKMKARVVP